MLISCGREPAADHVILAPAELLGGFTVSSVLYHCRQRAAFLDRELVCGNVLRGHPDDSVQCPGQCPVVKMGQSEYDIQADVADAGAAEYPEGAPRTFGVVAAVHPAEDPVIEALDAHADAAYSQRDQSLDVRASLFDYVFGVHFHGEFLSSSGM